MTSTSIGFAVLEGQSSLEGVRRGLPLENLSTKEGPALLSLKDGCRSLLIPIAADRPARSDRRSAGVHLYRLQLMEAGHTVDYVCIECRKSHLHDLFDLLIADVVKAAAEDPERPDLIASAVLDRWRELLDREPRSAPTPEVLRGIWGELWHARSIARLGRQDLMYWTGHKHAIWDLIGDRHAIEAKTITNRATWSIRIASELQLNDATMPLVLSVLRVDAGGDEGESIADLVDDLNKAGVDPSELVQALAACGLDWHQIEPTRSIKFVLLEHRAWLVDPTFPRIIPASFVGGGLPTHVTRIEYEIDLTTRLDAALSNELWNAILSGIAK